MTVQQRQVLLLLERLTMEQEFSKDCFLLRTAADALREAWSETPAPQYTTDGLGPLSWMQLRTRIGKPVLIQAAFPGAAAHIGFVYWAPVEQTPCVLWVTRGLVHQLNPSTDAPYLVFDYVKRARWVHSYDKQTAYCSNCRGEVKDIDLPKCCPECGARMNAPGKEVNPNGEDHHSGG